MDPTYQKTRIPKIAQYTSAAITTGQLYNYHHISLDLPARLTSQKKVHDNSKSLGFWKISINSGFWIKQSSGTYELT